MQFFTNGTAGSRSVAFSNTTLRFMTKVGLLLNGLLLCSMQLLTATPAESQNIRQTRISIEAKNETLRSVFKKIENQTDLFFAYRTTDVAPYTHINLPQGNRTVQKTLDLLLEHTSLSYRQLNNNIIIFETSTTNKQLPLKPADSILSLHGQVVDADGSGLPGASIRIKGSTHGANTNDAGEFTLKNIPSAAVLVVSSLGYETKEIPVSSAAFLRITLQESAPSKLNEVVIIGYGTTTQRANTGSVSSIDSKTIADQPVTNVLAAMQGRIPGLFISASNGMPGSNYSVRLRGQNSIMSGNEPLYIVDGVPYISEPMNQFSGANGQQSPLASINPADIERIDVLKDADATAIYGSRGANGVVLITTKKGKAGQTVVNFNLKTGIKQASHLVDMLNTRQYLQMRRDAFKNDGITPTSDNAPDIFQWDTTSSTNWQDLLIGNTAQVTEMQASVSGGNTLTRFLISGTYHKEDNILLGNMSFERGSVHLNLNHRSEDGRFDMNASVNYSKTKDNSIPTDLTTYYDLPPNYPIYDSTGKYYWYGNMQNPLAYLKRNYTAKTNTLIGNAVFRYTLLPGLNLKASLGYTNTSMDQLQTYPQMAFNPESNVPSQSYFGDNSIESYIIEPQATYTRKLGKGSLQLLLGATWQHNLSEGRYLYGTNYSSDALLDNIKAAGDLTVRNYNYAVYNYQSVFGRINYNWRQKYYINGTFRRDGSSRFGPGKRFGNFGAIGAAWIFTNEPFTQKWKQILSFGKIRASYGLTGNDQIGDYQYLDSWAPSNFPYGGISGLYPTRVFNPDYSWEINRKLDVALELGFLDDRILVTADYYYNRSGNQLIGYTLSSQTGFTSMTANLPALVQNNGWEFQVNTTNIRKADFTWSSSLNLTIPRNKLVKYPDLENSPYADYYVLGQPLNIVKGFHFTGLDPKTGIPQFQDLNGDSTISDPDDMAIMGNTMPSFYGGFSNSFQYKHWQLDFLLQFVKQEGTLLNYGYLSVPYGTMHNKDLSALDRWQKTGDNTTIPGATQTSSSDLYKAYYNNYRLSDAEWGDASYIRLKNIALRYDLSALVRQWRVKSCSVYVLVQNLFTLTSYDGFDPETQGYHLPPLRAFTAGIQFSL